MHVDPLPDTVFLLLTKSGAQLTTDTLALFASHEKVQNPGFTFKEKAVDMLGGVAGKIPGVPELQSAMPSKAWPADSMTLVSLAYKF